MRGKQDGDRLVAEVVQLAGGQVVGRVRLQKMFYLLDRIGLQSDFDYEYHYYGPYSAELADTVDDANAFGLIKERPERRASDGVPYSIFEHPAVEVEDFLGSLERSDAERAVKFMQGESATVLELAATIDWLRTKENVANWRQELVRRKGAKAQSGLVGRAEALLRKLGLDG